MVEADVATLQFVHHVHRDIAELPERVLEGPQPQIGGLADGEESGGHHGPSLTQGHLKQPTQDPTGILCIYTQYSIHVNAYT